MNELFSSIALVFFSLTLIGYMIHVSSANVREQAMLMKQQTDRLISEGNKRLEMSISEASRRHEAEMAESRRMRAEAEKQHRASMAESRKMLNEIGLTNRQILERVDRPEEDEN